MSTLGKQHTEMYWILAYSRMIADSWILGYSAANGHYFLSPHHSHQSGQDWSEQETWPIPYVGLQIWTDLTLVMNILVNVKNKSHYRWSNIGHWQNIFYRSSESSFKILTYIGTNPAGTVCWVVWRFDWIIIQHRSRRFLMLEHQPKSEVPTQGFIPTLNLIFF